MSRTRIKEKGIVLLVVLVTIFIVIIFANIILSLMVNQNFLSAHQNRRIQAFYAVQAASNWTNWRLRKGDWGTGSYSICASGCSLEDPTFPFRVGIDIQDPNAGVRKISLSSDYTYTE